MGTKLQTIDMYLRIMYKYRDANGEIRGNQIAGEMNVSQAAVTDMLKKMAAKKLIAYQPYKAVRFTAAGETRAMQLVRRHRLWEIFLNNIVGLPLHLVHDEATRLEQHASTELINRMEEILDFPEFDPHGDPIPAKNGLLPKSKSLQPLSALKENVKAVVGRVNDHSKAFLEYISRIGIGLESEITIRERRAFDGSLVIQLKTAEHVISGIAAENIFVSLQRKQGGKHE